MNFVMNELVLMIKEYYVWIYECMMINEDFLIVCLGVGEIFLSFMINY